MQPIEEILKEFDEECEGRLLWDPEIPGRALDDDSVRAFIEQALIEREKEAKLQRTKEILEMLPVKKDEEEFDARWNAYADGFNTCLFQIKELLTKTL